MILISREKNEDYDCMKGDFPRVFHFRLYVLKFGKYIKTPQIKDTYIQTHIYIKYMVSGVTVAIEEYYYHDVVVRHNNNSN